MKTLINISGMILMLIMCIPPSYAQKVGDKAPDFTYKNMDGKDVTLSSFKGKVVFLYLFGNHSFFCEASGNMTETEVQKVYGERSDIQALGLDLWDGPLTHVQAFQLKTKLTYPLLLNASSLAPRYSTTIDRVLVIDQERVLRYKGTTPVSSDLSNAVSVIEDLLTTTSLGDQDYGPSEGFVRVFPNPAVNFTRIRFSVERESPVNIRLFNTLGQQVRDIARESFISGSHTLEVQTADLTPGIYLVRMDLQGRSFSRKLIVNK